MRKSFKPKQKKEQRTALKLPDEIVFIGHGTVPTSNASVSITSIKQISTYSQQASKLGVFDKS